MVKTVNNKTAKVPPIIFDFGLLLSGTSDKFSRILSSKVETIVTSYRGTLGTVTCDLTAKMKAINAGLLTAKVSRKDILLYIMKMSEAFNQFAHRQR